MTAPRPDVTKHAARRTAPSTRLATALMRFEQHRRVAEHSTRLNVADLRLLWLFSDRRPRTLREIAQELNLEQSTVNRQVNAAHQAGLLDRTRTPERGAYVFRATEDGLTTFEQDVASSLGQYDDALASLGADDAARLVSILERFVAAYGETVDGAGSHR